MSTVKDLAKEIRVTAFGVGSMMNVVCIQPPKTVHDCGLYVHMDDIEKFVEYQKQMEKHGVQEQGKGT